jgi:hypothetical protein
VAGKASTASCRVRLSQTVPFLRHVQRASFQDRRIREVGPSWDQRRLPEDQEAADSCPETPATALGKAAPGHVDGKSF